MEALATQARVSTPAHLCTNGAGTPVSGTPVLGRPQILSLRVATLGNQRCFYDGEKLKRWSSWSHAAPANNGWTGGKTVTIRAGSLSEDYGGIVVEEVEEASTAPVEEPSTEPETTVVEEDNAPKAKVTFTLAKEIHFGQAFNLVGSIPELGVWDPASAVPLLWAEGHVWTTEVAIPVGQTVEYKYILTGKRGELEWQPGANRVIEIVDASDLVASELWDPHEAASVVSEEPVEKGEAPENVVAPGGDVAESITSVAEEVAESVGESVDLASQLKTISEDDKNGKPGEEDEASELPVVEAALATAVAEVRAEDADPATAEV